MDWYLGRNDDIFLAKVLPDNSLQLELRDGTGAVVTFQKGTWRVGDHGGWFVPGNELSIQLKKLGARPWPESQ